MASLGRLTIDMVANLAGFEKDMGRAQRVTAKSMQSVRRDLRRAERDADKARASIKRLGMQFAALAGVSMAVLIREFNQLAQQGDRIGKVAQGTGATVEAIQRLGFAAEQSGTSQEVLIKGLQTLQRNLQGARDGLTTYTRAFERIGVSTEELFKLNVEDQFLLIADALSQVENATTRSASAQEIFGRAGKELLAFFADGSQSAREWGDALERTGAVMSEDMINQFENFNDQLNLLSKQFLGLKVQIMQDLIGPMSDFVEFLNTEQGTTALKEALEDMGRAATIVGSIIGVRFVGQLTVAGASLAMASIRAAQATVQLATMSTTATGASAAFARLGIAIRTMLGPLGLAATALGVFALSSRESTSSLLDFNEQMRDLRFETRQFANEQQLAQDIQSFRDEAQQAADQIEQLKSGLEKLAGDRQPGERLRDYQMRMQGVSQQTELANAEIERLQQVQAEASRKADELTKEHERLATATRETTDATEELNDAMADDKRQQFLRDMQDLSDELEGPSAQAARAFAREIEALQELLDAKIISPEEYANFARGLAQVARQGIEDDKVEKSFTDVAADGISAGIEKAFASMTAGDISAMGFSEVGGVIGKSIFGELGRGFGEMFSETFSDLGESLGNNLGDIAGKAMGEKLGETFGKVFGEIAGPIGEALGRFIFDKIFPQKDPKFQVGGSIGFGATGAGRISMDLSAGTPFGNLFIRFRKITAEAQDQLRDALISFDKTIASIVADEGQMQRITTALAQWGFDTQDQGLTLERVLRSRFDAIVSTFDQFGQDMIRSGATLEEQITNMMDLITIRARMAIGDSFGGGVNGNDQVFLATELSRANETMAQSFQRLLTITGLLNKTMDLINAQIPGGTAAVARFGDALQRAFGDDLQRLSSSLNTVFETFFDADEILEQTASASRERASALLAQLGIELTDELLTVEGFRELFDSLFASLSPEQAAILIEAGVAISDFIGATDELNGSVGDATDSVNDMSAVLSERAGLERRLAQLTGDTAALRQMELDAVDESNRHLLERIFALEDEAAAQRELEKIATERDNLLMRELRLLGDTEEIRRLELQAVDESNREILKRIFALEDEAAAAAEATAIANERAGLERRLYTLLGDTAALRQMELDSLDPANRELLERIFAIEDERAANEAAARSAEEAARAQEQYRQELNKLIDDFTESMQGVEETILLAPLNDFQRQMVEINRQTLRTAAAINAAAGSAITQEQAERALARAHQAAAIQVQAAVAKLEASTVRLVQEVFGTPMDEINRQIALLEQNTNSATDAISNAADAMKELADFADSLLLGNLSPLSSREQLTLGLSELRAASQAGDVSAVQSLARQVLEIGRERFASGPEFAQLFADVQDIIKSTVPAEDEPQPVEVVESPALKALYEERDRMLKEQAEADRKANAVDIAQAVADIAGATGASFETVAKNLGVPLDELAKILGLDYDQIDEFLAGLQTDTMTLAKRLELFATAIKNDLHDMAEHIINQLQEPIKLEVTVVSEIVEKVVIDPGGKNPPKIPTNPPILMGDDGLANQGKQSGKSYDGQSSKAVEKNTAETVQEIRRLVDVLERSSTRSNRTALA